MNYYPSQTIVSCVLCLLLRRQQRIILSVSLVSLGNFSIVIMPIVNLLIFQDMSCRRVPRGGGVLYFFVRGENWGLHFFQLLFFVCRFLKRWIMAVPSAVSEFFVSVVNSRCNDLRDIFYWCR